MLMQISRFPCGERGLKFHVDRVTPDRVGRSPCGERGLKFVCIKVHFFLIASLPLRGAWIEIPKDIIASRSASVAPPAGSVD